MSIGRAQTLHGIEFQHYTAAEAREQREVVEAIFRGSYTQSGRAFSTPEAFMRRFDNYTDPGRDGEFELVMARFEGNPCGQAWGWPLPANAAWWGGLCLDDGDLAAFTTEDGSRTFALSEIMVLSELTGRGIAHALHDELLRNRRERRATLLVRPDNDRAYKTYRKWGWYRVGTLRPGWPDAPTFDALIRDLE
ncbi:GNAT family N-acetyltransferase [Nocardia suismassiliense]|uniref:GNAT family N-acetyltransferase n=1 Tax=Nocardia suismassiliense TaxID=2077092 RepID=UPI000D1E5505|nr:GNAT family N-acetyltransferase [Nocardia suismassiliense]